MSDVRIRLMESLPMVFGGEWVFLDPRQRRAIANDCIANGVSDLREYRGNIGGGNLKSYVACLMAQPMLEQMAVSMEELDEEDGPNWD